MNQPCYHMSSLLDEALKEKYGQYSVYDPLESAKDAIDWTTFPPPVEGSVPKRYRQGWKAKYSSHNNGESAVSPEHVQPCG